MVALEFCVVFLIDRTLANDGYAETLQSFSRYLYVALFVFCAVFIASAVSFLVWFYRAYLNLSFLRAPELLTTPGWAVGVWFIPILNLFRPYQATREIAVYSGPNYKGGASATDIGAPDLVKIWWGLWIITLFLSRFAKQLAKNDNVEMMTMCGIDAMLAVFVISTGAMAVLIVRQITSDQNRRYKKLASEIV